jgi:hypothetical protein
MAETLWIIWPMFCFDICVISMDDDEPDDDGEELDDICATTGSTSIQASATATARCKHFITVPFQSSFSRCRQNHYDSITAIRNEKAIGF